MTDSSTALLGCIADDLTGATDLALNLTKGGMRVVQVMKGALEQDLRQYADNCDAIVIALKIRSVPVEQACRLAADAHAALVNAGVRRFYFKYCSTFDSTEEGNIGPIAQTLQKLSGAEQTVYCPAFPDAGRTVYRGHLFVKDQLLHECGMQNHPVTPMTDANLVRWLQSQVSESVGLVNHSVIQSGARDVRSELAELNRADIRHVIVDTTCNADLKVVADATLSFPLLTGGSGLAQFLPAVYRDMGWLSQRHKVTQLPVGTGRRAILAGSCSQATLQQIHHVEKRYPTWRLNIAELMAEPKASIQQCEEWLSGVGDERPILLTSSADPKAVELLQNEFGRAAVSSVVEVFFAELAAKLVRFGFDRLVVAGGETSGAVVNRLGIVALQIGPEIAPGVPWTIVRTTGQQHEQPAALALKSGNFGDVDFFQRAMEMLP